MTDRNFSASGGTNGTTLAPTPATGQLAAGDTAFNTVTITAGSAIVFDTGVTAPLGLTGWLKFTAASGLTDNCRYTGMNRSIIRDSFYFRIKVAPTADRHLYTVTTSGGTTILRVLLTVVGGNVRLRFIDTRGTATPVYTGTVNIAVNTTYRVDIEAGLGAGTAKYNIQHTDVNGGVLDSNTSSAANTGTTNADNAIFGKTDSSTDTSDLLITGIQTRDSGTGFVGAWPQTAQTSVRPLSVADSSGAWTVVGAADAATALGDETDSSYVQSPNSPAGAYQEYPVALLDTGIVDVPVRLASSQASPTVSATIELREMVSGVSTVRATRTYTIGSTSFANLSPAYTLTQTESDSIIDRSQLRVRISAT